MSGKSSWCILDCNEAQCCSTLTIKVGSDATQFKEPFMMKPQMLGCTLLSRARQIAKIKLAFPRRQETLSVRLVLRPLRGDTLTNSI
jgi:hypothetical protein